MTPQAAIAMLDRQLAKHGADCILRRIVGTGANTMPVDVTVRARVDAYAKEELVNDIAETDSKVVMSPTQISAAQWPGGELPSLSVVDPSLPRRNDKLVVDGRVRNIEFVDPVTLAGELVRIEMRISG